MNTMRWITFAFDESFTDNLKVRLFFSVSGVYKIECKVAISQVLDLTTLGVPYEWDGEIKLKKNASITIIAISTIV